MKPRHGMVIWSSLLILGISGCAGPRPTEVVRDKGNHFYKTGDYGHAKDQYSEIVSRNPGDWHAQYMLGLTLMETGDYSAARRALEIAYTAKPNNQQITDALAEAMYRQGDENRLFSFLREQATTTRSVHAYLQLARYSLELGDPDSAVTAVETAIRIDNGSTTQPYLDAALIAERLGDLDEAVRRLQQAYGINSNDMRVKRKLDTMGVDLAQVTPLPPG